jgi:tetratricopeptide (TPR) repeat protein
MAVAALVIAVVAIAAFRAYRSARQSADDEFIRLSHMGKNYYDKGEAQKAVSSFQQALALNPTHPEVHLNLANAYLLANQPEQAVSQAQAVLELDRNSAAAYYLLGCAHLRLGHAEAALQALQQSQQIDPAVTALNFQLGLAHDRLGHAEDAIKEFQTVIKFAPEHPAAHYRLSQLFLRAGRRDEAAQALERHRELTANKPAVSDPAVFERCQHTEVRLAVPLERPDSQGIPVVFTDVTASALPEGARYSGPVGVIDFNHDGRNSLFVREGDAFRLLINSNGVFQPQEQDFPGPAGARFHQCLVGDLQNDRFEDIVVLGDQGTLVFKFLTNATISEVSRFANLNKVGARAGALVDLDLTGKLDLLSLAPDGQNGRFSRNLGNFYFVDKTATSGLPARLTGARQVVLEDWNNDDLIDVFITRSNAPPLLLLKQRGGPLVETNLTADWPAGALAIGDLNNDLRPDALIGSSDALTCIFNGLKERTSIPLGGVSLNALQLVDYDNDGWLDVLAAGERLRIWRNLGPGGFRETSRELGLAQNMPVEFVSAADFDHDGDTDLLLAGMTPGLRLLRNDGGHAHRQIKVRLLGTRSNASGLGVRIELAAGGFRTSRTATQWPFEIGVGRHEQIDSLNVRWFDVPLNSVDVKVEPTKILDLLELQFQQTGSCPYLYAWDGQRFRFVTDLLGGSPLGLPLAENRFIEADPEEYVWIGNEAAFLPREGSYVLQITEELREVLYLDEAKLVVVDHPAGTEVYPTSKLLPSKPFPPHEIVTLHNPRPLRHALDQNGTDVTASLLKADGKRVSPARLRVPQLRGLAEPHSVTLDFGPLPVERPLVLALTGWLRFGGGTANIAASHHPDLPFPFPRLEVETARGEWQPVDVVAGAPAGKTKRMILDLAGKLPSGSRRLRLSAAFEIHWDCLALYERRAGPDTHVIKLTPDRTDLHWRGFSEHQDLPWHFPLTPNYDQISSSAKWRITPMGWCTRYGAVDELLAVGDNALVLLNGGDELTLSFATDRLPPKAPGMVRDFFLYTVGWDKDADFHCRLGWLIEPLPWNGMDDQRYGHQPRPAFANDDWMQKYNTRWVGPHTLARTKQE